MAKRRRLSDLYVTGKEVVINDDSETDPIVIYLQKLNPLENEGALRKAGASRARVMAWSKNQESEEYLSVRSEVLDIDSVDTLIEYLIQEDLANRYASAEAELAAQDEWKTDDYYQGLQDAWNGGLAEAWAADPEDPESKRVYDELTRFNDIVTKSVEGEAEGLRKDWRNIHEDDLRDEVTKKFVKMRADMEWLREFRKQELYFATREPENHKKLYFESRQELDTLAPEVAKRLMDEYESLSVDSVEGKGSPVTPDSSPSSEASGKAEMAEPSGPAIVRG